MKLFRTIFTWWYGCTLGTALATLWRGHFAGVDANGNRYYFDKKDTTRRWVIYNGLVEASRVPPYWHGWLHGSTPEQEGATLNEGNTPPAFSWEKDYQPNFTGTPKAYLPDGSLAADSAQGTGARSKPSLPYEPWTP